MGGLLGAILFAGAGLALVTTGNVRIVGLLLLAMAVYGSWMIGTDYLKTKA
jgi:hypothetical protein